MRLKMKFGPDRESFSGLESKMGTKKAVNITVETDAGVKTADSYRKTAPVTATRQSQK